MNNKDLNWIKPGVSFDVFYTEDNPNNETYHIRGIVDTQVVVAYMSHNHNYLKYTLLDKIWFELRIVSLRNIQDTSQNILDRLEKLR